MKKITVDSLIDRNLGPLGELKRGFEQQYAPTIEYFSLDDCRVDGLLYEQPLNLMTDAILPITQNQEGWACRNFAHSDLQEIVDADFDGIKALVQEHNINLDGFTHYENGFERRIILVSPDESLVLATVTQINDADVPVTKAGLWRL
jgi:hypothetical protein